MKCSKIIFHCDLNNYYASVEMIKNPDLIGKPFAVCGNPDNRHGIILAKSNEAKAKGILTAETIYQAKRKCHNLILISPNHKDYKKYSQKAHLLYLSYTNKVEPFGIDEVWMDVSDLCKNYNEAIKLANEIKERFKKELKLTISIGISFNKVFAKLGSDLKKPDAVTVISNSNWKNIVWKLKVEEIIGIGKKTAKILNENNIYSIYDLSITDDIKLSKILGKNGRYFKNIANGISDDVVRNYFEKKEQKSISLDITLPKDIDSKKEVFKIFQYLTKHLSYKLCIESKKALVIQISIKYNDFKLQTAQLKMNYPTRNAYELSKYAMELFNKNYNYENKIRMLGVRANNLINENTQYQLDFLNLSQKHHNLEQVGDTLNEIQARYGRNIIGFGKNTYLNYK